MRETEHKTDGAERRYANFAEFWAFYVTVHAHRGNRWLHVSGTLLAISLLALALISQTYWLALLTPVVGYGFAWIGHFVVERNQPATFTYPLWSFFADFKMLALTLLGRMPAPDQRQDL